MDDTNKNASIVLVADFCTNNALREALEAQDHQHVAWSQGQSPNSDEGDHKSSPPESTSSPKRRLRHHLKRKRCDDDKTSTALRNANVRSKRISVETDASSLKLCRTVWLGIKHTLNERQASDDLSLDIQQVLKTYPNLKLVQWDGRNPIKITDKEGRIIVHLGGRPHSKSFKRSMKNLEKEMRAARIAAKFPERLRIGEGSIRGDHPSVTCGYTFPAGSSRPSLLKNGSNKGYDVARTLSLSKNANRVRGIQAAMLKCAAPRMYDLYCETDRLVRESTPDLEVDLQRSFKNMDPPGSYPFAAVTYNFGEQTVCNLHRDCMNFGPGWCAITSLGNYNPRFGGHIVLLELGLVIEFPPGATILIPSAMITHFNTTVSSCETRMSIVRYTAGNLFAFAARIRQAQWTSASTRLQQLPSSSRSPFQNHLDLYMTINELNEQLEHFTS